MSVTAISPVLPVQRPTGGDQHDSAQKNSHRHAALRKAAPKDSGSEDETPATDTHLDRIA